MARFILYRYILILFQYSLFSQNGFTKLKGFFMNFLPSCYIYPLEEKIQLSASLGLSLDNARTEEEIGFLTKYIRNSNPNCSPFRYTSQLLKRSIFDFCKCSKDKNSYLKNFTNTYRRASGFEVLARSLVVVRYEDHDQHRLIIEETERVKNSEIPTLVILEDDHPIVRNSNQLVDYSHLLSLLIHTEEPNWYDGSSFIEDFDAEWYRNTSPRNYLGVNFYYFLLFQNKERTLVDPSRWKFFPFILDKMILRANQMEKILAGKNREKLMYLGNLLRLAGLKGDDAKTGLVTLVSMLELLLTHNPDYNRFNVESSISKQFQLKASLLIYLNDRSKDLDYLKKRLKEIYGIRSGIAHGDFLSIMKYVENRKKQGEEFPIDMLNGEMYDYVRAVLEEYIKDEKMVDFLKEG